MAETTLRAIKKIQTISTGVSDYVERRICAMTPNEFNAAVRACHSFRELRSELEAEYYFERPSRLLYDDE